MEDLLKMLFDFQKFLPNEPLGVLIEDTKHRFPIMLADDELELVNAAGEPRNLTERKNEDGKEKSREVFAISNNKEKRGDN